MTEAEWLACEDFRPLWLLRDNLLSARKARLLACAWCGRVTHLMDHEALLALEAAERFADGLASPEELVRVRNAARLSGKKYRGGVLWDRNPRKHAGEAARYATNEDLDLMLDSTVCSCSNALNDRDKTRDFALLIREIVGNPFRPSSLAVSLRTPDVLSIAEAAYSDRVVASRELFPDRLAVLADALEEAGCTDAAILTHLRSSGPHVRGCWALDLILAKN